MDHEPYWGAVDCSLPWPKVAQSFPPFCHPSAPSYLRSHSKDSGLRLLSGLEFYGGRGEE